MVINSIGRDNFKEDSDSNLDFIRYQLGTPTIKHKEVETAISSIYQPNGKIASKINIQSTEQKIGLAYSFQSDEIAFGNLIHQALSQLKNKNDIEIIAHQLCIETDGYQNELLFSRIKNTLSDVFKLMESKSFISPEWTEYNELEICDVTGKILRPDRVLMNNNQVIIIDFKTGIVEKEHRDQVLEYTIIFKAMGYEIKGAYLIYTATSTVVPIDLNAQELFVE